MQETRQEPARRQGVRHHTAAPRKSVPSKVCWEVWIISALYAAMVANAISILW